MLQARLYRASFVFAIFAVVAMAFSVVSRPQPLELETSLEPFDEAEAAADARRLLNEAPDRRPGSEGAAAAAAYVEAAMADVEEGTVEETSFEAAYDGERVEMANISLTLSGETEERVVLAAARDCAGGPCVASSAASTGALLELARGFSRGHHEKTFEFVSTEGSVAGAAGARRLGNGLADEEVTAIVFLSAAGAIEPGGRTVIPWSTGTRATSVQLVLSAGEAVRAELSEGDPPPRSTLSELVRLAIPAGLGEQAPLVADGYPAIGLSGAGPRPLSRADDEQLSVETLGMMGRTTLALSRALDAGPAELDAGPSSRIPLAGKLVPGWALALLSATLLVPIAAVAIDSLARASRAGAPLLAAIAWLGARAAAILALPVVAVLLGLVGILPSPPFPFDPAAHRLGLGPAAALALLLAVAVGATLGAERLYHRPASEPAVTAALSLAVLLSGIALWFVNPYLALVLAPTLHLWMALSVWGPRWKPLVRVAVASMGLLSPLAAAAFLGAQLGTGIVSVPWQLLLMLTGGHFSLPSTAPIALLVAAAVAALTPAREVWTDMRSGVAHGLSPNRPIRHTRYGRRLGQTR